MQTSMSEVTDAVQSAADTFHTRGFCVVEDIVPTEDIKEAFDIGMSNFREVMSIIAERQLDFGIGAKNGFREIVQRHESRYEVPYMMDRIRDATSIFSYVCPYAYRILGPDAHVVNCSLVISEPGSKTQSWHVDGPHLQTDTYLPCHCLNIFVPLIDMTMELGPTELRPGSHFLTRDLSRLYLAAFMKKKLEKTESPLLRAGSILLFDYRTLHRGLANTSNCARPVFVLTFALPWFKDVLNFPPRSISDSFSEHET